MPNINVAEIAGHAGQDAELRYTQNGKPVCTLSIATSSGKDDKKHTEWHKIIIWGTQAEKAAAIKKGDAVLVKGEIKTRSWEKDGQKHYATEIHTFNFWHRPKENKEPKQGFDDLGDWNQIDDIPF